MSIEFDPNDITLPGESFPASPLTDRTFNNRQNPVKPPEILGTYHDSDPTLLYTGPVDPHGRGGYVVLNPNHPASLEYDPKKDTPQNS
jgi:hypothetical protein